MVIILVSKSLEPFADIRRHSVFQCAIAPCSVPLAMTVKHASKNKDS